MFREIIDVYSENHAKLIISVGGENAMTFNVKSGDTESSDCDLRERLSGLHH